MASQYSPSNSLPQGFSVYQPALGLQLQFFPALGSQELDDMINAYIPGPASIKEKRASVSLDFLEHAQLTGQTFKFYPVYSPSPLAAASPVTSVSSFNVSPVNSTWDFSNISASASVSPRSSTQSRKHSKANSSTTSRQPTADFSHIPGMKIMTKDGLDVTNSASRGSKTKEQRDHAHLMRIIKACDSCRRKKVRCDPSHKKRPAPQTQSQPAGKPAKKARTAPQKPATVNTPAMDDALRIADSSSIMFEPAFSFTDLETLDNTAQPCDLWEEFVQYPPTDADDNNYDFFLDPEGYLSSQSPSSTSSSSSPQKSLTPSSLQESLVVPGMDRDGLQASPQLPHLDQSGSFTSYTDFNLFSPGSTFSEDDRMLSISSSRHLSPTQLSDAANAPGLHDDKTDHDRGGATDWNDWNDWSAAVSPLGTSTTAQPRPMEWYDPGDSPGGLQQPIQDFSTSLSGSQVSESPGDIIITVPQGGTVLVHTQPGVAGGLDRVMNNVSISSSDIAGTVSISVESDTSVEISSSASPTSRDRLRSEPSVENISRSSLDDYYRSESLGEIVVQDPISSVRAAPATVRPSSGDIQDNAVMQRQEHIPLQSILISDIGEALDNANSHASCPLGEIHNPSADSQAQAQPQAQSVGLIRHTTVDVAESPGVLDEMIQEPFHNARMANTTTDHRLRILGASDNTLRRRVDVQSTSLLQDVMNDVLSLLQSSTSAKSQLLQGVEVRVKDRDATSAQEERLMTIRNAPMTTAFAIAVMAAACAWNVFSVIAGSSPFITYMSMATILVMMTVLGHVSSNYNNAIASNVGKLHSSSPADNSTSRLTRVQSNEQSGSLDSLRNQVSALHRSVARLPSSHMVSSLLGSSSMSMSIISRSLAVSVMG